jgi:hypothetical protein
MSSDLNPLQATVQIMGFVGGFGFLVAGVYLSVRRGRIHPLLPVCIAALSISWIESPYDWAMYAQFPPGIVRMPSWWPLNVTWGGLPAVVPTGYITYFALPALLGAELGRRASVRFGWRRPIALLAAGFGVGFVWAFFFNALIGARFGTFYYGRVIPGLALWPGTKHQYPIYDAVAMAVLMMVFAYLLGRTDSQGRNLVEAWSDSKTSSRLGAAGLYIAGMVVIGNVLYGAVFAPHLATKLMHKVTVGPKEQLYPGVENQPLDGGW